MGTPVARSEKYIKFYRMRGLPDCARLRPAPPGSSHFCKFTCYWCGLNDKLSYKIQDINNINLNIRNTFLLNSTEEKGTSGSSAAPETKGRSTKRQKSRDNQGLLKVLLHEKKTSIAQSSVDEGLEVINHLYQWFIYYILSDTKYSYFCLQWLFVYILLNVIHLERNSIQLYY